MEFTTEEIEKLDNGRLLEELIIATNMSYRYPAVKEYSTDFKNLGIELHSRMKPYMMMEKIEDKYIELISLNKIGSRIDGIMEMYLEICKIINPVAKNGDGNDNNPHNLK